MEEFLQLTASVFGVFDGVDVDGGWVLDHLAGALQVHLADVSA